MNETNLLQQLPVLQQTVTQCAVALSSLIGGIGVLLAFFGRWVHAKQTGNSPASAIFSGTNTPITAPEPSPAPPAPPASPGALKAMLACVALCITLFAAGCSTSLAPGGAYSNLGAPGPWLFGLDTAVNGAYTTLDGFETWELSNYQTLKTNAPSVVAAAETIRTNAPRYFTDYTAARAAFLTAMAGTNAPALVNSSSNALLSAAATVTNLVPFALAATNGLSLH